MSYTAAAIVAYMKFPFMLFACFSDNKNFSYQLSGERGSKKCEPSVERLISNYVTIHIRSFSPLYFCSAGLYAGSEGFMCIRLFDVKGKVKS